MIIYCLIGVKDPFDWPAFQIYFYIFRFRTLFLPVLNKKAVDAADQYLGTKLKIIFSLYVQPAGVNLWYSKQFDRIESCQRILELGCTDIGFKPTLNVVYNRYRV